MWVLRKEQKSHYILNMYRFTHSSQNACFTLSAHNKIQVIYICLRMLIHICYSSQNVCFTLSAHNKIQGIYICLRMVIHICYSSQDVWFPADLTRTEEKGGNRDRKGSGGWGMGDEGMTYEGGRGRGVKPQADRACHRAR